MPDAIANLTQGLPVEIGKIDRELKRLWQEGEGAATRASLINFAVYCEGAGAMRETTDIISQITRDHACRAILIGLDPAPPGSGVEACISAHCHLSRAGANWTGLRGYVQTYVAKIVEERAARLGLPPIQPEVDPSIPKADLKFDIYAYICGLNNMVAGVRDTLAGFGWHRKQIVFERYD